jgi:hypothetical protein
MRALLWIPSLFLVACSRQAVKPDSPAPVPAIVEVPVPTFVPISDELTARCEWVDSAPLQVIPSVARGRKKCLQQYEGQLDAIKRVQGRPVPAIGNGKPAIPKKK